MFAFLHYRVCILPRFCYVAEFADETKQYFYGFTRRIVMRKIEGAQRKHGDIAFYDYVTDEFFIDGQRRSIFLISK